MTEWDLILVSGALVIVIVVITIATSNVGK